MAEVESGISSQKVLRQVSYGWLFLVATLLFLSLLGLLVADRMYQPDQFRITDIQVVGKFNRVNGQEIKRSVENTLSGNYFSASLQNIEQDIENLPWVFSASVRRQWPSTLIVNVSEVEPIARWGDRQWLNFTGDLVAREQELEVDLPQLLGPDSQQREVWKTFKSWSGLLARNGLQLEELFLDNRGLWHLQVSLNVLAVDDIVSNQDTEQEESLLEPSEQIIDHNVTLIVDSMHPDKKIRRFVQALNQTLIIDFPNIESVDLRYPNGFAVGWRDDSSATNLTESN